MVATTARLRGGVAAPAAERARARLRRVGGRDQPLGLRLLAGPLLVGLHVARIEIKHAGLHLVPDGGGHGAWRWCSSTAARAQAVRAAGGPVRAGPRRAAGARRVRGGAASATARCSCWFSLLDHRNLATTVYDLGIYDNLVWQTAHGHFLDCSLIRGGNHMSAHFGPILLLLAADLPALPARRDAAGDADAVARQRGAAARLAARRRLKNEWMATIPAFVYFLYPALHGVNMFDFHSVALMVPLAMWAHVCLLDAGAMRRYWLVFALLLATREDISLLNCFIGAYAILHRSHAHRPGDDRHQPGLPHGRQDVRDGRLEPADVGRQGVLVHLLLRGDDPARAGGRARAVHHAAGQPAVRAAGAVQGGEAAVLLPPAAACWRCRSPPARAGWC